MISFIKGIVEDIEEDKIIIDSGNIGYNIFVPSSVINKIGRTGVEVKIYTYLSVREDAMVLFGFLTKEDLKLYKQLITVNGVGPKAGLSILSTFSSEELKLFIMSDDSKAIAKAPGIGSKTASKIILELKDKIDMASDIYIEADGERLAGNINSSVKKDAMDALIALGYSSSTAMSAVNAVLKDKPDIDDVSEIIKFSLKYI